VKLDDARWEEICVLLPQLPTSYSSHRWYPAVLPGDLKVEIRKTSGRGRAFGDRFLWLRRAVPLQKADGTWTANFRVWRINLCTRDAREIS